MLLKVIWFFWNPFVDANIFYGEPLLIYEQLWLSHQKTLSDLS